MPTNQLKILITLPFDDSLIKRLKDVSLRVHISQYSARNPEEIPDEVWAETEVLYTHTILPDPEKVPNLRWVQLHWAGVDHAIHHPLLNKPDLTITHLSGANASQMAEFILMMMLALGHHQPELTTLQQRKVWPSYRWGQFQPVELRGSTVGIVGYGSIGRQTARLLVYMGAKVLATKRDAMQPADTGYSPDGFGDPNGDFVQRLYPPQALRSMLQECDFTAITVPLTDETTGMISEAELAALPPGAKLVNVSRGDIIDQTALLKALQSGHLGGAALDVYPVEPLPSDDPLWQQPNVILTPHISGFSQAYDQRAVDLFVDNLTRYLENQPLYNCVDLEKGY